MKNKLITMEEQQTNTIACFSGIVATLLAYAFVMIFLNGTKEDAIALIAAVYCFFVYLIGKKHPTAARYLLACAPALGSIIIIVSNNGHYSAMDQTYFLCLIVSVIHYDILQVLLSASMVLITNIAGFLIFPEPYLKIHNTTVWVFVAFIYMMATFCALLIAGRTHNLFKKERELQLYESELIHLKQLEKKNEEHSKFIHNLHHYFSAIGNLAAEQNFENILSILNDLNVEITNHTSIIYTNHCVTNAILSEKFSLAKGQQIPMDIYVEPNVSMEVFSDADIVIMLGNLLDNALEAAAKLPEKERFIKVRIYNENNGKFCVIKTENSFLTPVKYNKKGLILSSKKNDLHGFGLKSVNQTANKYGGYLQCSSENNVFTAILLLSELNTATNSAPDSNVTI